MPAFRPSFPRHACCSHLPATCLVWREGKTWILGIIFCRRIRVELSAALRETILMYSSDNNEIPSWLLGTRTFNSLNIVFVFFFHSDLDVWALKGYARVLEHSHVSSCSDVWYAKACLHEAEPGWTWNRNVPQYCLHSPGHSYHQSLEHLCGETDISSACGGWIRSVRPSQQSLGPCS